jgi:hypothetical protein
LDEVETLQNQQAKLLCELVKCQGVEAVFLEGLPDVDAEDPIGKRSQGQFRVRS